MIPPRPTLGERFRPTPRPAPEARRREPMMTALEVADYLRVSKMTVYRLVHEGEIASIRVGRSIRIRRSEFERYLSERE